MVLSAANAEDEMSTPRIAVERSRIMRALPLTKDDFRYQTPTRPAPEPYDNGVGSARRATPAKAKPDLAYRTYMCDIA